MTEKLHVIEADLDNKWEIVELRPGALQLRARSPNYIMSVVPTMSPALNQDETRNPHQVEVVFFKNTEGEMGDQITEGGIISDKDLAIEAMSPDWWSEFAGRYGNKFASLPTDTKPTSLFDQTFPDILEARESRLAKLTTELPIE